MLALCLITLCVSLFWAAYDQQGNTIVLWAEDFTDRMIDLGFWRGDIPTTWLLALNPLMIFVFTPVLLRLWASQARRGAESFPAAKMALGMPSEDMWKMFDGLGFGQPLKLGFPGEAGGRLRPWKRWRPIEQATMSYGHGISVTLIQLARAYQMAGMREQAAETIRRYRELQARAAALEPAISPP